MTRAVIAGPDEAGLGDALDAEGVSVSRAAGTANRPAMEEAGIVDADLLVLTDTALATSIPVAKDLNADLRVIVYAGDALPEFAKGQADILLDPALFAPDAVAEELADGR
ncbi:MAG: CTP synthetase [Haloarculaceae archaeon]